MFGTSWEVIGAVFVATLVRLSTSKKLTFFSAFITSAVGMFSGLILYSPLVDMFGLSQSAEIPMAIIVALTAENLMRSFVEVSADGSFIKRLLKTIVMSWTEK